MEKTDVVIIGAGVVGLAIANRIAKPGKGVIVIEKHDSFGREASSRNSEVIHAGIYYPKNSLKAKLCVEGKELLYEFCSKYNIPHRRIGKLIVATDENDLKELDSLTARAKDNSVKDLKILNKNELKKTEPHITAMAALYSPSTGILDTHQLMKTLEYQAKAKGAIFAYNCEATGIKKKNSNYEVEVLDADNETVTMQSQVIINSAGINSDKVATLAGIDIVKNRYKLSLSKGEYFRVNPKKAGMLNTLVYPTPLKDSLGVHTVLDMQNQMKLGPNAFYTDDISYDVEPSHAKDFYNAVREFLPFIGIEDLSPDTSGIRAKLQISDEVFRDFVITDEGENGFAGFINLIGIESPGFTASLAIAKYVENML